MSFLSSSVNHFWGTTHTPVWNFCLQFQSHHVSPCWHASSPVLNELLIFTPSAPPAEKSMTVYHVETPCGFICPPRTLFGHVSYKFFLEIFEIFYGTFLPDIIIKGNGVCIPGG